MKIEFINRLKKIAENIFFQISKKLHMMVVKIYIILAKPFRSVTYANI